MINSTEDIFFTSFFILFFLTAISWITFAQFTMRPIEKRIKADGIPSNFLWDGVGARISFYAFAIVFPKKFALRLNRLIDVELIRRYADRSDWMRGLFFLVTINTWLITILMGVALGYAAR